MDDEFSQAFDQAIGKKPTEYPIPNDPELLKRIEIEKSSGYDLAGYIKKYGVPDQSKRQHLTDEFKLPNHVTFSSDSIYSTPQTPGGQWSKGNDGHWHYKPSDFVLQQHPREKLIDLFKTDYAVERDEKGNVIGRSVLDLP